jgi:hypothetical protein
MKIEFSVQNFEKKKKKTGISNLMTISPVEAELFHADGRTHTQTDRQTDRHEKANSYFAQFCERS